MLFAQISDTHISAPGRKTYGIAPMAENLARCVKHLNALSPCPELVLVTGDISNSGKLEELQHAAMLLEQLQMPYYVIPGNHDSRELIKTVFKPACCPTTEDHISYVIAGKALRLIGLDSTYPGQSGGQLCPARAEWLDTALAADTDTPTVIFMHHPPLKCGVIETDIEGFDGHQQLAAIIDQYTHIEKILCGHIHLPSNALWHGTVVNTAPSMGMQLVLDLNLQHEAFTLAAPAYQLHYWTADKHLITHTQAVPADDADGPYDFVEQ